MDVSWTIKKAEHWRIDAFELWCRRKLLRVPLTARRSKLSVLKEINPEYSLEGLMVKLKPQYFGHLMQRANSIAKDTAAWKDWGQEEKGVTEDEMVGWHHWLNRHEFEQTQGDGKGQGSLACCSPWGRRVRHDLVTEQQWQFPVNISPSPLSFWIRGCGSFLWFRFLPHPSSPGFLLCIHLALIGLVTWIPSRLTAGDVVWQFTANISYVWCETLCTKVSPVFLLAKKKRASPESYYRPRYSALSTEVSFQTEWNGYNKWRQKQIVAERKRCLSKSRGGASRAWRGSCVCAERVSAENFGQT